MFTSYCKGEAAMGGSSFKRILFWKKKKTSPLEKAWKQMRRALPNKKRKKKKKILSLDKLRRKKKHSQKNVSQTSDKKEPGLLTRLSLGSIKKESTETASPTKKDVGALEKIREQIKGKTSRKDSTKGLSAKREDDSVNQEETKGENGAKNKEKVPKKTLKGLMKSIRPTGPKANREAEETEQ